MSTTLPPKGTHFSDGVRVGAILGSRFVAGASVLSPSKQVASPIDSHSPGVYVTPTTLLDIIPASVNTANLFALATIAAAGYVPLITTNSIFQTYLPSFSQIAFPEPNSAQPAVSIASGAIKLDVPRNIIYTGLVNSTAVNLTVWGYDQYEQPMTETVLTTAGAATTTLNKAFLYITAIYVDAGTGANVSIGVGNKFGLPYYLENANDIFSQRYNNALDAGTITIGDPLPATGTTGDVRGTYTPASNADSVKRLTINAYSTTGDTRLYNGPTTSSVYLANNALATAANLSPQINVTAPGHQFTTGELVTISGGTGTINNVTAANYNISATVTVISANSFSYNALTNANGAGAGGGAAIQMTPGKGNLYQTTFGRFGVNQYAQTYT